MVYKKNLNILLLVIIFSVSMGFLESAVVVYMRELYYPQGFKFPLVPITSHIANTELFRELVTLLMLPSVGLLAGRNKVEKFAYFILSFAIWDISYYVFLKVVLNWPESLFTWDLLFLIPTTWVGPVLAPIIISLDMILLSGIIIYYNIHLEKPFLKIHEKLVMLTGAVIVLVSFMLDYVVFVLNHHSLSRIWSFSMNDDLFEAMGEYVPSEFNWWVFSLGELLIVLGIVIYYMRYKSFVTKSSL